MRAGDADYSPLFVLENAGGEVYNAPIVSSGAAIQQLQKYCNGIPSGQEKEARKYVHDKVMAICPDDSGRGGTVTLKLTPGFSFARPVLYLRYAAIRDCAVLLNSNCQIIGLVVIDCVVMLLLLLCHCCCFCSYYCCALALAVLLLWLLLFALAVVVAVIPHQ
jgi:hypothetical protein